MRFSSSCYNNTKSYLKSLNKNFEITKLRYTDFLPQLNKAESINEKILKFSHSIRNESDSKITKEILLKSFLKLPSVRLRNKVHQCQLLIMSTIIIIYT